MPVSENRDRIWRQKLSAVSSQLSARTTHPQPKPSPENPTVPIANCQLPAAHCRLTPGPRPLASDFSLRLPPRTEKPFDASETYVQETPPVCTLPAPRGPRKCYSYQGRARLCSKLFRALGRSLINGDFCGLLHPAMISVHLMDARRYQWPANFSYTLPIKWRWPS